MASNKLKETLIDIGKALEKHNVSYMLIGGTAVALNGYYRPSINSSGEVTDKPDLDVWYNPTYGNYFAILKALKDLGQDISVFEDEQSPNPRTSFFKLEFEGFTFDLLPKISADISFYEADKRKETVKLEGVYIHFMCVSDLIEDKKATGRKKDFEDVEQLKRLRGE